MKQARGGGKSRKSSRDDGERERELIDPSTADHRECGVFNETCNEADLSR